MCNEGLRATHEQAELILNLFKTRNISIKQSAFYALLLYFSGI